MVALSDKSKHKMLQALAHELCHAAHPDTQITMTGWMSLDGDFLVSCATHKMIAKSAFDGLIMLIKEAGENA